MSEPPEEAQPSLARSPRTVRDFDSFYDTVIDSGLFHSFEDDDRARLVRSLRAAVAPGGHYFLLCFTDQQPGDWGPRRVSQDEIRASFADGWRVEKIEAATFEITLDPAGALSWLATITRT